MREMSNALPRLNPDDPPFPAAMLRVILSLAERLLVERGETPWDEDRLEELAGELGEIDPAEAIRQAAETGVEALTNEDLQRLRFFVEELYEANYWVEPEEEAGDASHENLWAELGAA
jgi:hypothetical protein